MPTKDPLVYVMHIRDSCRRIAEYRTAGGADWPSNPMVMDAVCRNITIIGEAARKDVPELLTNCLLLLGDNSCK